MVEGDFPLAVVTGAARRLGRVFALELARRGYSVLLHYHRSAAELVQTADEVRAAGVPVYTAQADLSDPEKLRHMFSMVDSLPHEFKVLVNSAAVMQRGDVRTLAAADFDATLALNLRAPFLCSQEAARRMRGGGLIVNITDVGAQRAWSGFPAYTVSKAALESLTRVLARALAPDIRVNAIAPGLALAAEGLPAEEWDRLTDRVPMQRTARPEELSAALAFLLENRYITGETITVDGGYSLL